jgi:glycosyltransferase involved in cell wall biosynthesis
VSPLHHLVVGPPGHGVVRYAELLLAAAQVPARHVLRLPRRAGREDVGALADGLAALERPAPNGSGEEVRVHLHVTDHLLGGSPEEALDVVRDLARRGPVSLTLHDLPQPSDGTPAARRRACYAGLVEVAVGVVVSSDHEAALLAAATGRTPATPVRVVPLAVPAYDAAPPVPPRPTSGRGTAGGAGTRVRSGREVAVLGWVYPGKGHAEVLAAMGSLPADVGLRVLGGASPGHEDLLDRLGDEARAGGRTLVVDGWVDDDTLPGLLRSVDVPVFAPRHVSASASLTTWLSAGRRPVAARSQYTEEVERRAPGTLLLVDDRPDALADGIRRALEEPGLTWLDPDVPRGLDPVEAACRTFAGWQR